MAIEVVDTPPELKGGTATKRPKPKLATGIEIMVPEYIGNGERCWSIRPRAKFAGRLRRERTCTVAPRGGLGDSSGQRAAAQVFSVTRAPCASHFAAIRRSEASQASRPPVIDPPPRQRVRLLAHHERLAAAGAHDEAHIIVPVSGVGAARRIQWRSRSKTSGSTARCGNPDSSGLAQRDPRQIDLAIGMAAQCSQRPSLR